MGYIQYEDNDRPEENNYCSAPVLFTSQQPHVTLSLRIKMIGLVKFIVFNNSDAQAYKQLLLSLLRKAKK